MPAGKIKKYFPFKIKIVIMTLEKANKALLNMKIFSVFKNILLNPKKFFGLIFETSKNQNLEKSQNKLYMTKSGIGSSKFFCKFIRLIYDSLSI